jgi:hypothetical protein
MKKLLIVLSFVSLVSCSNQKYIYTINYSKTVEDYTVVTLESIVLSKQDSTKAINKFKKSPSFKTYASEADSVWIDLWVPAK